MPKVVSIQPTDEAARQAALDTHKSFIVEAPAGSGKTSLLVQRFLKLLADPATALPEEVLAITFTRKATAEMLERVLAELNAAHTHAPLSDDKPLTRETRALAESVLARSQQLGWGLPAQSQRLNVRSILSICVELANARPLLDEGVGPMQPVTEAGPLLHTAARRTLLQLGGPDTALSAALRTVLLHRDGNLANCTSLLVSMLHSREQWGELIPLHRTLDDATLDNEVRPHLEETLSTIVCSGLQHALNALPVGVLEHLTAFAQRHAHLPGHNGKPSPIALCSDKHQPPGAVAHHLDHWRALIGLVLKSDGDWRRSLAISTLGFKPEKAALADHKALIDSIQTDALQAALRAVLTLPSPFYPDDQWAVARALFRVLRHALAELKVLFAERGQCDFSEFSLAARQVLATQDPAAPDAPSLAASGTLRHLLVDELQDTSSSQYELFRLLTQSWDGSSQTLFLVGDPKQSIYLFRQARVERFLRTFREARLGAIDLTPLRLTANFRSQAALVHAFNDTFGGTPSTAPIFPPPGDPTLISDSGDVPFVAATPRRDQTLPTPLHWHTAILGEELLDTSLHLAESASANHNLQEALEVRRIIEARLALPLPPGRTAPWSIAVLARARSHFSAIIPALKAHDGLPEIPFRGLDLEPLNERPEVLDALALTRALLHPADRIAWLAVLRAPWCGLANADLLALAGDDPDATLAQLIPTRTHLLSAEGQQLLARVWPVLLSARNTLGRTSLTVHLERLWRSLGGDAWLDPTQQTNVLRYLALVREQETELGPGRLDLAQLNLRLAKLYAEPRSGPGIQVELLTIHSAKGLEWDLVLVPGLHRRPQATHSELLNWVELDANSPGGDPSIVLAPIWSKGDTADPLNDWLKNVRSRRERGEEKRLVYVAATRAREELHLFAALDRKANGDLAQPVYNTLLKAAWPAAQPHFASIASAPNLQLETPNPKLVSFPAPSPVQPLESLALAASADADVLKGTGFSPSVGSGEQTGASAPEGTNLLERLPLTFHPLTRFTNTAPLAYTPASALPRSTPFDRPEGSFAVRAFGNVVHRYLQLLAQRLTAEPPATLLAELPTWLPRLTTSLRGEGLAASLATREAARALHALTLTLNDPTGLWLLTPHPAAASETDLTTTTATLRFDRTFLAGPTPLSTGDTHIWIIDFKTTEPGTRSQSSLDAFAAAQLTTYTPQLEAYANLRRTLPDGQKPIQLALYYPLIPRLLHQPSKEIGNRK
jgi:ATP-dependent exoDNAse (exonuclease V) beta subunit